MKQAKINCKYRCRYDKAANGYLDDKGEIVSCIYKRMFNSVKG